MIRCRLPMDIQLFADPAPGGGDPGAGGQPPQGQQGQSQDPVGGSGQQTAQIDYSKIQQMLDSTLATKEDSALKAYFKQQGLSQQEAEQAIADFSRHRRPPASRMWAPSSPSSRRHRPRSSSHR